MPGLLKKLFFWRWCSNPKTGKIFTVCFGPPSQSIGRGRISREGALDVRESRGRRNKIVPNYSPEKHRKNAILAWFSTFLSRIACCSRESRSAWQNFRQKEPTRKKQKRMGLRFSFQKWACASRFQWGIFSFVAAEKLTFGGVILQNRLASDHPGAIQACPARFLAQKTFVILKKRSPSNDSLSLRHLY